MDGFLSGITFCGAEYVPPGKKSGPIIFWARHDNPNQSYNELEIHASTETRTNWKYVIRENYIRIDHDYNIGDKVMVRRNQGYKQETLDEQNRYYTNGRDHSQTKYTPHKTL